MKVLNFSPKHKMKVLNFSPTQYVKKVHLGYFTQIEDVSVFKKIAIHHLCGRDEKVMIDLKKYW